MFIVPMSVFGLSVALAAVMLITVVIFQNKL
jgi:hypothetical protein